MTQMYADETPAFICGHLRSSADGSVPAPCETLTSRILPLLFLALAATAQARVKTVHPAYTVASANDATKKPVLTAKSKPGSYVLRAQILLDRAHCSPGEIDGRYGGNTRLAVTEFNLSRTIKGGASVTAATWDALNR